MCLSLCAAAGGGGGCSRSQLGFHCFPMGCRDIRNMSWVFQETVCMRNRSSPRQSDASLRGEGHCESVVMSLGLPWWLRQQSVCLQYRRSWPRKTPWRRTWQPTQCSCLESSMDGGACLVGFSPWGCKESDTTERLHFLFFDVTQSVPHLPIALPIGLRKQRQKPLAVLCTSRSESRGAPGQLLAVMTW